MTQIFSPLTTVIFFTAKILKPHFPTTVILSPFDTSEGRKSTLIPRKLYPIVRGQAGFLVISKSFKGGGGSI